MAHATLPTSLVASPAA